MKPICYECAEKIMDEVAHTRKPINAECHKCHKGIFTDRVSVGKIVVREGKQ